MDSKIILVLGGYGGTGAVISRGLLKETDVNIIIAGRRKEKAEELSRELEKEFTGNRVPAVYADTSDSESLKAAFRDVDLVIVCSNSPEDADKVARSAIDEGCDYLDIHCGEAHIPKLYAMRDEIKSSGRCFITQAGSHPGIAPAFVRYAASRLESIQKVILGGAIKIKDASLDSAKAFIRDLVESRSLVYRDGKWRKARGKDSLKINFGPEMGRLTCYPVYIYEMETVPSQFQIDEAGVYMSGIEPFVDPLVFIPAYIFGLGKYEFTRNLLARLMLWGMKRFTKPPLGFWYKMEAFGKMEGEEKMMEISTYHPDPYVHTAIPVISCLLQYLDGTINKPGLWMMGHIVDPARFLSDMERQGMKVAVNVADIKSGGGLFSVENEVV